MRMRIGMAKMARMSMDGLGGSEAQRSLVDITRIAGVYYVCSWPGRWLGTSSTSSSG